MTAIISLLIILTLSFLITRLATAALTLTGLSHDVARLQAVSAYTGVGFTTHESESIVGHPVRRRVLIALIIIGNVGIVTAISSLILSFAGVETTREGLIRTAWLLVGLIPLWAIMVSRYVDQYLDRVMRWALNRWTHLEAKDYASLLGLTGEYSVQQWRVDEDDWVANRTLADLHLADEGITVLGVRRANGEFLGVPRADCEIQPGDRMILYGRDEDIGDLAERRRGTSGEQAHQRSVANQEARQEEERSRDEAAEQRRRSERDAEAAEARQPRDREVHDKVEAGEDDATAEARGEEQG